MAATYTKLKDGNWGLRVTGTLPTAGESVTVKTKAGEVKTETVDKVVWSGEDRETTLPVALCTIKPKSFRRGGRYECEECGEMVTRGVGVCWETGRAH